MTSGRATIATGGIASLAAVTATFGLANFVGHRLGFDLWPMPGSGPTREIEVPALSPSRVGVNPLLPASNALGGGLLSRGAAGGFGVLAAPVGFPGATVPGLSVTTLPGASTLPGIPVVGGGANARRNGGRGSVGNNRPSTPSSQTSTPSVPQAQAPSEPSAVVPVANTPATVAPDTTKKTTTSNSQTSNSKSSNTTTTAQTQQRKSNGRQGTPPGQRKQSQPTTQQSQPSQQPAARSGTASQSSSPQETAAAPAPDQSGSSDDGDGRTPSSPPGQGKGDE